MSFTKKNISTTDFFSVSIGLNKRPYFQYTLLLLFTVLSLFISGCGGNSGSGITPLTTAARSFSLTHQGTSEFEDISYQVFSFQDLSTNENMPVFIDENPDSRTFIIRLHGGPGGTFSPGSVRSLHEQYTLVYWQQRGSGYASGPRYTANSLNKTVMVNDLKSLITELKRHYGNDISIVLSGQSWGVTLALHFISQYPTEVDALILDSGSYDFNTSMLAGYRKIQTLSVENNPTDADEHFRRIQLEFSEVPLANYSDYTETVGIATQNAHFTYLMQSEYILTFLNGYQYGYESFADTTEPTYFGLVNWRLAFTDRSISIIPESSFFNPIQLTHYISHLTANRFAAIGRGSGIVNILLQPALQENLSTSLSQIQVPVFFLYGAYDLRFPSEFHNDICTRVSTSVCRRQEFDSSHVVLPRINQSGTAAQEAVNTFLSTQGL